MLPISKTTKDETHKNRDLDLIPSIIKRGSLKHAVADKKKAKIQKDTHTIKTKIIKRNNLHLGRQLPPIPHSRIKIADKIPPVAQWTPLVGKAIVCSGQILHPIDEPGQAVGVPAFAIDLLLLAAAIRFPIFNIRPHVFTIGPIVISLAVGWIMRPTATRPDNFV